MGLVAAQDRPVQSTSMCPIDAIRSAVVVAFGRQVESSLPRFNQSCAVLKSLRDPAPRSLVHSRRRS
jgi:hypothetical protein